MISVDLHGLQFLATREEVMKSFQKFIENFKPKKGSMVSKVRSDHGANLIMNFLRTFVARCDWS